MWLDGDYEDDGRCSSSTGSSSSCSDVDEEEDAGRRRRAGRRSLRVIEPCNKYLVFTMGSRAGIPHQLGFKLVRPFAFMHYLDAGPSLAERVALLRLQEETRRYSGDRDDEDLLFNSPPALSDEEILQRFDQPDHVIDLHGHIIGMAVSPDQRLDVNSLP
jgi:F-box/WD-40 domain protein 5